MVKLIFKCLDCTNQAEVMKPDEDLSDAAIPMCIKHAKPMRILNFEFKKGNIITRRKGIKIENIQ